MTRSPAEMAGMTQNVVAFKSQQERAFDEWKRLNDIAIQAGTAEANTAAALAWDRFIVAATPPELRDASRYTLALLRERNEAPF